MSNGTESSKSSSLVADLARSYNASFFSDWYSAIIGFLSGGISFYVLTSLGFLVILGASIIALDAIRIGYHEAYAVTREIPWGLLISSYIFFVVTSTGLCIIAAIGHVFGIKSFMPVVKRAVFLSIVIIVAGFTTIFFEIENPFRMAVWNVLSPNLTSNIWWMGTLYGAYLLFMIVEFVLLLLENHRWATYLGLAGLISGIAAHSNLGAIFGMLHGREYWYGPYMPIYFIASAAVSGGAAIIFFTWLGHKITDAKMDKPMEHAMEAVSKLSVLMLSVILFFTTWKIISGLVGAPAKYEAIMATLTGPYAFNFWGLELAIGMVIPLVIFLATRCRSVNASFVASAMMLFGIFFMRYDLLIVGQIVPAYSELGVQEYQGLLSYSPSFHEIGITVGAIAIVATVFMFGEYIFRGYKSEVH